MTTISTLKKALQKKFGEETIENGVDNKPVERLPFGIFALDFMMGGGIPIGKQTIMFGPEASGKSNLALKLVASMQSHYPEKTCVYVDLEGGYDSQWAQAFGVDTEKLLLVRPDHAEDAVDIVTEMTRAEDLGLLVIDSIAALTPERELETSSSKIQVGGVTQLVGRLNRVVNQNQNKLLKQNFFGATVVYINQLRDKVGVIYGSPETMPGGRSNKHFSTCILRVAGKMDYDKSLSEDIAAFQKITVTKKKARMMTFGSGCEFNLPIANMGDHVIGQPDNWPIYKQYLYQFSLLTKESPTSYILFGHSYKTLTELRSCLETDRELSERTQREIFSYAEQEFKWKNHTPVTAPLPKNESSENLEES